MRLERENKLEERSVAKVEAAGGVALKLVILGQKGFPDRAIFLPSGRFFLCELKRRKVGVISAQQSKWAGVLRGLGFAVYVISSDEEFDLILKKELNR